MDNFDSAVELPRRVGIRSSASSYVSHVLDLPPLVAIAAFDAQTRSGRRSGHWVVEVPGARLDVRPPVAVSDGSAYHAYRAQRAHLLSGWWRAPMELELMPWSEEGCELGLRAFGRFVPARSLLTSAEVVLGELAARMQDWEQAPVRAALAMADPGVLSVD